MNILHYLIFPYNNFFLICYPNMTEAEKLVYANRARMENVDGFQGCANLGKGCDFEGYYLCSYSEEGLCKKCELKTYPDRFTGCGFCGKANQYTSFCWSCQRHFKKWLFDLFYNKNKYSKSTNSCHV